MKTFFYFIPVAMIACVFAFVAVMSVRAEGDGSKSPRTMKKELKVLRKVEHSIDKANRDAEHAIDKVNRDAEHAIDKFNRNIEHAIDKVNRLDDIDLDFGDQDSVPSTLSIGPKGKARITSGSVTAVASSTIAVSVWKLSFTVHNMPNTNIVVFGGGNFTFDKIKVGDVVDVNGELDHDQIAFIHAAMVRDRSATGQLRQNEAQHLQQIINQLMERLNKLLHGGTGTTTPPTSVDTQAPSKPTGLTGIASSTQAVLSWDASTDNVGVTGYKIFRCNGSDCSPSTMLTTAITNSYVDTGLSASTTYSYSVSAYDAAGNNSDKSSASGVVIP